MTTQDIIDRVRKLRKLATSSNVHEAATAAAIADKLIQEHRLEEAAIDGEEHSDAGTVEDPEPLAFGTRTNAWQWFLYTRIALHYDLASYSSWRAGVRTLHLVGRKSDIEVAKYQMAFYVSEINRLAMKVAGGMGRSALNSFRLGAVSGILAALKEAKAAAMANAATSTAMVLADRYKEARDFMGKAHPDLGKAKEPDVNVRDGLMYLRGQQAGRSMGAPKKGALGE